MRGKFDVVAAFGWIVFNVTLAYADIGKTY